MAVPSAFSLPALRRGCGECVAPLFRLIDSSCEPHCQLDSLYSSLDEAIADAIARLSELTVMLKGGYEGGVPLGEEQKAYVLEKAIIELAGDPPARE